MNRKIIKIDPATRYLNKPQTKKVHVQKPKLVKKDPVKVQEIKDLEHSSSLSNQVCVSTFRNNRNSSSVFIIPENYKLNYDLSEPGLDVISANSNVPSGYFVTRDYSYINEKSKITESLKSQGTVCVFVITESFNKEADINTFRLPHFNYIINSTTKFSSAGFSTQIEDFTNWDNTEACAIQLAVILGYQKIYLLGFNSEKSYRHQSLLKAIALYKQKANIKCCNCSSDFNQVLESIEFDQAKKETMSNKTNTDLVNLLVVGYYTQHTPYETEAQKLIESCRKFSLDYDIISVPSQGSWQLNTRFKAKFMLDMLHKHPTKRLLYVDCDAIFQARPDLFINYNADVAVRFQDFNWKKNECLSGTIYMENNLKTRRLCEMWIAQNQNDPNKTRNLEQWNLGTVIENLVKTDALVCKNLPPEYTFIFDSMRKIYPGLKPVIEHFQASRKYKRSI